ncbi:protein Y24D9A.8, isoform b, partial [Jimgerdemannia flammicorona]
AVANAEAGVTLISPFVGRILDWYKKTTGKEYALAGCDLLTISTGLLAELHQSTRKIDRKLSLSAPTSDVSLQKFTYLNNEAAFRWDLNEDAMATEKLAEGICNFAKDGPKLRSELKKRLMNV